MKALLLVAHGSRRAQSNQEVSELAKALANSCRDNYFLVRAAFLELAEPSITDSINSCCEQGATEIVILPYFLNRGRHVSDDVPAIVNKAKSLHPSVTITTLSHIGASEAMLGLLSETANKA